VRKLCRTALLSALALLSTSPAILFVPIVHAGAIPAAASRPKKNKQFKKHGKNKLLKGRHGKHARRPA
jgi:hypothetical protein